MDIAKLNDAEIAGNYGDTHGEYWALRETAGILDLSFRGRLCVAGSDRARFLHGQVTNDVKSLRVGEGCYAALITAKGKMQSDLNIYCLQDELLLDFEPGLTTNVSERLEKYVIADDVQIVDVAPHYGLLSVQGPKAEGIIRALRLGAELPNKPFGFVKTGDEVYLMNQPRLRTSGFYLFIPITSVASIRDKLIEAAKSAGGRACGSEAFEIARLEAGIPRFGIDMDETTNPLEAGLETRAISFTKGCYIGQEVISRIRTYSEVARALRGLKLADNLKVLPAKGDKLFHDAKEAGFITSAIASPGLEANIALGYVKREMNQPGTELILRSAGGESQARVVELPFLKI
jgi:folate-binding protein YgfZ